MMINKFSKIILIFLVVLSASVIFHRSILTAAGRFLAPTSKESTDVLILEGTQTAKRSALKAGIALLSNGRVNRMVVVLHSPLKEGQVFTLPKEYPQFVIDELVRLGLKKEQVEIISAPIPGHPITLSEARFVVAKLSQNKVRSAILVGEGFHTRRSFAVYKQEGDKLGLHIVPYSYFTEYKSDSWWHDTQGISDFLGESLKLSYYLLGGYISIGALWN
jgi:hypothetical protein